MNGIPGAEITVDQEQGGPPTDPPVNIEIASENFDNLIKHGHIIEKLSGLHPDCRVWKS